MAILLADDESRILQINRLFLEKQGYTVYTASDGQSALELFEKKSYAIELCVLDVMMPNIDGLSLCQRIKSQHPEVKVIILTARSEDEDQLAAFEHLADDYVPKPYSIEVLLKRIEKLLPMKCGNLGGTSKEDVLSFDKITLNQSSMTVKVGAKCVNLSPSEYKILLVLMKNQLQVVPETVLLQKAFKATGTKGSLQRTVSTLKGKLLDQGEHIINVWGEGYKLTW